jgi:lysophospholipase L1-like esterase
VAEPEIANAILKKRVAVSRIRLPMASLPPVSRKGFRHAPPQGSFFQKLHHHAIQAKGLGARLRAVPHPPTAPFRQRPGRLSIEEVADRNRIAGEAKCGLGEKAMPFRRRHSTALLAAALVFGLSAGTTQAQNWTAAWTASAHGPYPIGNPTAQPEMKFAFPAPERGARDQSFRMIVRPDVWGTRARIRLSNVFGTKPITFDGVFIGLQASGSAVMAKTTAPMTFGGANTVTIEPGRYVISDPTPLAFVRDPADPMLANRRLAVSFHVVGESGPMTWHAKSLTSSYLTLPGAGSRGGEEDESAFPQSTTSWYFLDEVDMDTPRPTKVVVAFGDSITDGTASTVNGDDRWPDVLARRLHGAQGNRIALVNQGIGGNQVIGPPSYGPANAVSGGPSALSRLERDVIALPGVATVIWLEGINDFGPGKASSEAVIEGVREGVKQLRARVPGVRIVMATLTSALHAINNIHGTPEAEAKRQAFNAFVRGAMIFDAVVDFDKATIDPATGELKAEFQPNSSTGGPGDKLHPNRLGYQAMGNAFDLASVTGD